MLWNNNECLVSSTEYDFNNCSSSSTSSSNWLFIINYMLILITLYSKWKTCKIRTSITKLCRGPTSHLWQQQQRETRISIIEETSLITFIHSLECNRCEWVRESGSTNNRKKNITQAAKRKTIRLSKWEGSTCKTRMMYNMSIRLKTYSQMLAEQWYLWWWCPWRHWFQTKHKAYSQEAMWEDKDKIKAF